MVVLIAMFLSEVFERFISESPLVVMLRVVLEQSLSAEEVDRVFLDNAQEQYEKRSPFFNGCVAHEFGGLWHCKIDQFGLPIECKAGRSEGSGPLSKAQRYRASSV